jgi:hypothetical protein
MDLSVKARLSGGSYTLAMYFDREAKTNRKCTSQGRIQGSETEAIALGPS